VSVRAERPLPADENVRYAYSERIAVSVIHPRTVATLLDVVANIPLRSARNGCADDSLPGGEA
jgi:hypothetical protein